MFSLQLQFPSLPDRPTKRSVQHELRLFPAKRRCRMVSSVIHESVGEESNANGWIDVFIVPGDGSNFPLVLSDSMNEMLASADEFAINSELHVIPEPAVAEAPRRSPSVVESQRRAGSCATGDPCSAKEDVGDPATT
ncbi:unnamed protein product [Cylindrotheca closterium]|uniref:Uncharacterized protein n=1 Tax=Cylindrotheca closterium TaxID=2856 RepID=A0AAD2PUE7_9STRA|nr:unnamed protein product [Cylindrotheca closterium]